MPIANENRLVVADALAHSGKVTAKFSAELTNYGAARQQHGGQT
jgi:hypothetical protein